MSGVVNARHTEVIIKEGNEVRSFELSIDAGRGLLNLLQALQLKSNTEFDDDDDEGFVPAEVVFPELKDPQKLIGIVFRGVRHRNNLTQEEFAKRLGLDQSDVSKIERGERSIGKALAKKIEKEFGIEYRRFL